MPKWPQNLEGVGWSLAMATKCRGGVGNVGVGHVLYASQLLGWPQRIMQVPLWPLPRTRKNLGCGDLELICVTSDCLSSFSEPVSPCMRQGSLLCKTGHSHTAQSEAGGGLGLTLSLFHRSHRDASKDPKALRDSGSSKRAPPPPCSYCLPASSHPLKDKARWRLLSGQWQSAS